MTLSEFHTLSDRNLRMHQWNEMQGTDSFGHAVWDLADPNKQICLAYSEYFQAKTYKHMMELNPQSIARVRTVFDTSN